MTQAELAREYERRYGVKLRPLVVSRDLCRKGIRHQRPRDENEIRQRPKRLTALRRQFPKLTYRKLADEYERRYGVRLEHSTLSHIFARFGMTARPRRT